MAENQQVAKGSTKQTSRINDPRDRLMQLKSFLGENAGQIIAILPDALKSQAERYVSRALLTMVKSEQSDKLFACTDVSILDAILAAAENGFAMDGHLAYMIPYGNQAQCQFDYRALIIKARRVGIIADAWAQGICENDDWEFKDSDGKEQSRQPDWGLRGCQVFRRIVSRSSFEPRRNRPAKKSEQEGRQARSSLEELRRSHGREGRY